jgi:cytochrome c oxidase assembly protein subunit 15
MSRTTANPWLARFARLTALATLVLVCFGGLVTSHEAGMAVPDWPNTFGHNLFFFPVSQWVGGIFYEHTHRLVASGVGLLTTILAVWLWLKESRRWLRWLGIVAFLAVVLQGVLGGLRVVLFKDELGIVHATLGQLFFVLTCSIVLFASRWWPKARPLPTAGAGQQGPRRLFLLTTLLIVGQLMLGATMRHQHAGLAILDFPTAYGHLWPVTDADSIARYNQNRVEATAVNPITAFQIVLQMVHRIVALVIFCLVAIAAGLTCRQLGWQNPLSKMSLIWFGLVMFQVFLGAATIWTGKSADIATAHVACGALSLMTGTLLSIISFRGLAPVTQQAKAVAKEVTRSARFVGLAS